MCVLKAVFILRLRSVFTCFLIVSRSCQLSGCMQFSFSACLLIGNDIYFKLLPRTMATAAYPRLPAVLTNSYDLWLVNEGETNAEIQAGELIGFNVGSFKALGATAGSCHQRASTVTYSNQLLEETGWVVSTSVLQSC